VTNVTFHQGTLEGSTLFEPQQFDCVWAYSFLHLIDDRPRTLRAVFDLLKPGGSFISSNVSLGDSWIPYNALISVARWLGKAPKVHIYDRATITRELRVAGFTHITERDVGAEKTIAFIVAQKPALERSP